jgi:hypothetical protein
MDPDQSRLEAQTPDSERSFEQRFGWYAVINRLANDDVTRHPEVLQITVVAALNQLSYLIQKDQELIKRQKEAFRKG